MSANKEDKKTSGVFFSRIFSKVRRRFSGEVNVYFISGMCYNCKVFERLKLPKGYTKHYLEWYIPAGDEPVGDYARKMAEKIDTSSPFVLVGYSFGAVIMQEMNRFLTPLKCIVISSFKSRDEIPTLFRAVHKVKLVDRIPGKFFSSSDFVTGAFNYLVYHMPNDKLRRYMTYTDPVYIKWAVASITAWVPESSCQHLFHIHGTRDQVFPFKHIHDVFPVEGGDHLMVIKKAGIVSSILASILLMK